jgi:hypothetical protein
MSIVNEYSTYDDISLETSSWTVYASGATQIIDIDPSGNVVRTTISIPTATGKTISVVTDNAGISQINTVDSEGTVLTSTSVQNTSSSSPITRLIPRSDSYAISTPSSVTIAAVDVWQYANEKPLLLAWILRATRMLQVLCSLTPSKM